MRIIEIPDNPNCVSTDRVFHELEPPRPVVRVRLTRRASFADASESLAWCDVTGWTADGRTCPALIQKIDDSGDGVAFLLYGGDGGLRFRPAGSSMPWRLNQTDQWGEPFVIVTELSDVVLQASTGEGSHG